MGERFNENFYYKGGRWWDFYRKWKGCSASLSQPSISNHLLSESIFDVGRGRLDILVISVEMGWRVLSAGQ